MPYLLPVLLTLKIKSKDITYLITILGVILTCVGFYASPDGGELWKILANRALAVFAIVSVGLVVILVKNKQSDLLVQTEVALQAQKKAVMASEAKSKFLSSMSHEFNTPLNAIIGFSELLKIDPDLNLDQQENVEFINDAGKSILAMVAMALEFSDIQEEAVNLSSEPVEIAMLISQVVAENATLASKNSVVINTDALAHFPIKKVQSNAVALKQVLQVLLKNAIQYNYPDGRVVISNEITPDQFVRIYISNTGPGIPECKHLELFKPFSRLGRENASDSGIGLGLAKSKVLIEAMKGRIGYKNNSDDTVFWVDMPFADLKNDCNGSV